MAFHAWPCFKGGGAVGRARTYKRHRLDIIVDFVELLKVISSHIDFRLDIIWEYRDMFWKGAKITVGLTAVSIFFGSILGLIGALMRLAKSETGSLPVRFFLACLRGISLVYVTFFRGTPLFVQIFIWYFVWFAAMVNRDSGWLLSGSDAEVLRTNYGALIAGGLALSVNTGAYMTEIFRAGIQSIEKGQVEAARSLGLNYVQTMRHVILPQAVRRMLPPFANEFITLLKDSSLLSAIAVAELAFVARTISGRYYIYKEPYYTIALMYLILTVGLTWLFSILEKKLNKSMRA